MSARPVFEDLVESYSAEIFAYVWRLTRDPQDAEDCLQESFARAFKAFDRLNGNANARAWLYRIATNTTFTYLKKRRHQNGQIVEADLNLASPGDGPAEAASRRETLAAVARAVEGLPARQQAALVMRKYQELSYPEIAQALGCSEDAARANVYQALKSLRGSLGGHFDGQG